MNLAPRPRAFAVNLSATHFSVMAVSGDQCLGVADGNEFPGKPGQWWLARLKVNDRFQGQGLGTELLKQVFEAFRLRDGFEGLLVSPGGYGSNVEELTRFYEAQGFVKVPHEEGLLRWRPSHLPPLEDSMAKKKVVAKKAAPKKATQTSKPEPLGLIADRLEEILLKLEAVERIEEKLDAMDGKLQAIYDRLEEQDAEGEDEEERAEADGEDTSPGGKAAVGVDDGDDDDVEDASDDAELAADDT